MYPGLADSFWKRVDQDPSNPIDGCWNWTGSKLPSGYGRLSHRRLKQSKLAHRLSYEFAYGPIPGGLHLDHLCRNRACVNPLHLEAVTVEINVRRSNTAKLTQAQVDEIRRLIAQGSTPLTEIAHSFGVSQSTISKIKNRTNWT